MISQLQILLEKFQFSKTMTFGTGSGEIVKEVLSVQLEKRKNIVFKEVVVRILQPVHDSC